MMRNLIWIVVSVVAVAVLLFTNGAQLPHINFSFHPSEGVTGGIIGIVGSLIGAALGSFTAYRYNVSLESKRTQERRAIQTKNTIFSPIYKQLLGLQEYLEKQQLLHKHPEIIIYFTDYSNTISYTFDIWESMKKDIRKRYVPVAQREDLDRMTQAIKDHMDLQSPDDDMNEVIARNFYQDHKDQITDQRQSNHHMLSNTFKYHIEGSDNIHGGSTVVESQLRKGFTFTNEEYLQFTDGLVKAVAAANDQRYALLEPSLEYVVSTVNEVTATFEKIVDTIIEKYEGGIDVR